MTIQIYAQPYDLSATGFYFENYEEYTRRAVSLRNAQGDPVEEFEIQFIDGEDIDCDLAKAIGVNQANLRRFFDIVADWDQHDKTCVIIAVGECGYRFEDSTEPDDFDVDYYHFGNWTELAEQFFEEGVFGSAGDLSHHYIDFEAMGRDLSIDYGETAIAGRPVFYRCG